MNTKNPSSRFLTILPFFILVVALAALTVIAFPQIDFMSRNPRRFADVTTTLIRSYGVWGVLIYIVLQMIHVIIVAIPGEITQMIGGYVYGIFLGTLYTEIGIVLGVIVVFSMVRFLGYPAVKSFVPIEKMKKFDFLMNDQRAEVVLFVLFLIPGIPKDALTYLAGLTPIKPIRFLVISAVARFPGILGSVYMGAKLGTGDYKPIIVVAVAATVLFVIGVICQKSIVDFLHRLRKSSSKAG